jgi:peptidoglycan hydrolase-like protein with peptidoglycan-binding domain
LNSASNQAERIIRVDDNLRSKRFAGNPRLEAAYENAPPMRKGEVGEGVALVQEALVDDGFDMPISTKENGEMDGIFGSETFCKVWAFQEKHDLETDGVVGHDTLGELQV